MLFLLALPAIAEPLRIATWHADLSRRGPGLLLRDILKREEQVAATIEIILATTPDVLVLTDFDYDAGGAALRAMTEALAERGLDYPHHFQPRPNTGMRTGRDLDRNGRLGEARDAQGYGRFAGDGGLAVLSRWPVIADAVTDHAALLWRDLPDSRLMEEERTDDRAPVQRLGTAGHWIVPIDAPGGRLDLWVFAATPPVFDGPEDRNGRRNADEIALWSHVLEGEVAGLADHPFVIAGLANLDPADGEGLHEVIAGLLADDRLSDPRPQSRGGAEAATPGQRGDPALDTADFSDPRPGNLRLSYVLPSAGLRVQDAGVVWPAKQEAALPVETAGRHRMVWVDLAP